MATIGSFAKTRHIPAAIGLSLHEVVNSVYGFFIRVNKDVLVAIENITDETARDDAKYSGSSGCFVFWLVPNEHVTSVCYCTIPTKVSSWKSSYVCAVRFKTNQRSSQWFGKCQGEEFQYTATDGHSIHAVWSQRDHLTDITELKAVDINTPPPTEAAQATLQDKLVFSAGQVAPRCFRAVVRDVAHQEAPSCTSACFRTVVRDVRVIVVKSDTGIQRVQVLSSGQYDRLESIHDRITLQMDEHIIELVKDEQITGVDCTVAATSLSAIRFVTTHRKMPWFGNPKGGEVSSMSCADKAGARICGVFGRSVAKIVEFGVVVATPNLEKSIASNTEVVETQT